MFWKWLLVPVVTALSVSSAYAQGVVLKLANGMTISGDILEFDGDKYLIKSPLGEITVPANDVVCEGEACPLTEATVVAEEQSAGNASEDGKIRVKSLEGDIVLEGTLKSITNDQYVIYSQFGIIAMDIDKVTCEGTGCIVEPKYVFGENVTLKTADQTISGVLIDVNDGKYVIGNDIFGVLGVDISLSECTGPGCPE